MWSMAVSANELHGVRGEQGRDGRAIPKCSWSTGNRDPEDPICTALWGTWLRGMHLMHSHLGHLMIASRLSLSVIQSFPLLLLLEFTI